MKIQMFENNNPLDFADGIETENGICVKDAYNRNVYLNTDDKDECFRYFDTYAGRTLGSGESCPENVSFKLVED